MADKLLDSLRQSVQGLLYPSESDAPFDVVSWSGVEELDAATIEKLTRPEGSKKKLPVKEVSFEDFFAELTDGEDAAKFAKLKDELESHLSGLRVFRVGEVQVNVYVVGRRAEGEWVGLHTVSVET